jgi:hypothetical protein
VPATLDRRIGLVRALGIEIGGAEFWVLNGIYMAAMVAAVAAAPSSGYLWMTPALGTLVAGNGFRHLAGSVATRGYSPGLISGLLLWLPLGVFALQISLRVLPPHVFWSGVGAGILAQAGVAAIVLPVSLVTRRGSSRSRQRKH